jgi:hypothetical protein
MRNPSEMMASCESPNIYNIILLILPDVILKNILSSILITFCLLLWFALILVFLFLLTDSLLHDLPHQLAIKFKSLELLAN